MPLPLLRGYSDDQLFPLLNAVMLGWGALALLPRWRHTPTLTLSLVVAYSAVYALLVAARAVAAPAPAGAGVGSLDAVIALFSDREIVFAGWTHYIAFDLFVGRHIVMDSQAAGMPHLTILPLLPLTLMAGPAGFAAYAAMKWIWWRWPAGYKPLLVLLYTAVTLLCLMMVGWVLILPSSWLYGNSEWHDQLMTRTPPYKFAPVSLLSKYTGHRAVQFLHILPSAAWSASLPLQLNPWVRKKYPGLHRTTGYACIITAQFMTVGYVLIDLRGLMFHEHDFPQFKSNQHMSKLGLGWMPHKFLARFLAMWFSSTAIAALYFARTRDFPRHQAWVIRHVGSGIWVALQRLYVGYHAATSPATQKAVFADGLVLAASFTIVVAELAVLVLLYETVKTTAATAATLSDDRRTRQSSDPKKRA